MIAIAVAAFIQATTPTQPAPLNPDSIVTADLNGILRDVESARITQTRAPRWATVREDAWTVKTGWAVCYSINAQNGHGGYTGAKTWLFVLTNDHVEMRVPGGRSIWFDAVIDRECKLPADPPPRLPEDIPTS